MSSCGNSGGGTDTEIKVSTRLSDYESGALPPSFTPAPRMLVMTVAANSNAPQLPCMWESNSNAFQIASVQKMMVSRRQGKPIYDLPCLSNMSPSFAFETLPMLVLSYVANSHFICRNIENRLQYRAIQLTCVPFPETSRKGYSIDLHGQLTFHFQKH